MMPKDTMENSGSGAKLLREQVHGTKKIQSFIVMQLSKALKQNIAAHTNTRASVTNTGMLILLQKTL